MVSGTAAQGLRTTLVKFRSKLNSKGENKHVGDLESLEQNVQQSLREGRRRDGSEDALGSQTASVCVCACVHSEWGGSGGP